MTPLTARLDGTLGRLSFFLICIVTLLSPWFFGAWEMWWFWPFVALICAACFFFALRVLIGGEPVSGGPGKATMRTALGAAAALFLVYAFVRMLQADVYIDAERSFLLFLTPFLLAALIIGGCSRSQLWALFALLTMDLFCLGIYGIANHRLAGSVRVLWVPTETVTLGQYAGRATGSYFCPDHFSGIMEMLLAIGIGLLMGKRRPDGPLSAPIHAVALRLAAVAATATALAGVWLSQSRGGALTAGVTICCGVFLATAGLRPVRRWISRAGFVLVIVCGCLVARNSNSALVNRFKEYAPSGEHSGAGFRAALRGTVEKLRMSSRYNMYSAALRAWKETDPVWGIGPGMHQHLWFRYAASPDGDREAGKWPSRPNAGYHSYEVHSDWLQLLEEYGIVGLVLFLGVAGTVWFCLLRSLRRGAARPVALGGTLCGIAMAFHSFGDFNLQMPATAWLLSAILSIALVLTRKNGVGE